MSSYGFTGFPLRDSLPRGFAFVDFMRTQRARSSASAPSVPAPQKTVPGGFSDAATETTLSEKHTTLGDGTVRTDAEKLFSDGSRRSEIKHRRPDGSFGIETVRRSLPDAEGFEKVRVWDRVTAPDGSQSGAFRVFRVPAGMQPDWNSPDAQRFLLSSNDDALSADGTFIPNLAERPTEAVTGTRRDDDEAPARPVIPLAP